MCIVCGDASHDPAIGNHVQSSNPYIKGLQSSLRWSESGVVTLSYQFASTSEHLTYIQGNSTQVWPDINGYSGAYNPLTAGNTVDDNIMADVRQAFSAWSQVTNVQFNEFTTDFPGVDIKIGSFENLAYSGGGLNGIATFPRTDSHPTDGYESFVMLNATGTSMHTEPLLGASSNRLNTTMHEFGHMLGLTHPQDTFEGDSWTSSSLTGAGDHALDNNRYTIMSAERGGIDVNSQGLQYGYAVTPMALDIAAAQQMYGSAASYEGATSYVLTDPETAARDLNGNDGTVSIGRAFYSIWDTGGIDEIRYGGANHVLINLNEATLDVNGTSAAFAEWFGDISGTSLYAGLSSELKDEISNNDYYAGGFFSRVFYGNGAAALGGYSIASAAFASSGHAAGAVIENGVGSGSDDMLIGNEQANNFQGNGGSDVIHGSYGNDSLYGGEGNDRIYGGADHDMIEGGIGADDISGGNGFDYARYDSAVGNQTVSLANNAQNAGSEAGGDTLAGIEGLIMGSGNDWVYGNAAANYLYGQAGNDSIFGGAGADYISGGSGFDYARYDSAVGNQTVSLANNAQNAGSEAGGDTLVGIEGLIMGSGNDWVYGNAAANYLYGQVGNDSIFGGAGADYINGGIGFDYARYNSAVGNQTVSLAVSSLNAGSEAGGDILVSIEGLIMGAGNDWVYGSAGDNYLYGGGGNDNIFGGGGADYIHGGAGFDYARYDDASYAGVTVSLDNNTTNTGVAAGDVFVEIEGLILTNNNDTAYGNAQDNYIYGNGGSDVLNGRGGRDTLYGGAHAGVADYFVFDSTPTISNSDRIMDFQVGVDKVVLAASVYGSNPASIYFDAGTSNLFWAGNDLSSSADDVLIANLNGITNFGASDFYFS